MKSFSRSIHHEIAKSPAKLLLQILHIQQEDIQVHPSTVRRALHSQRSSWQSFKKKATIEIKVCTKAQELEPNSIGKGALE